MTQINQSFADYVGGEFRKNRVFMLKNKTLTPSMIKVTEQGVPTGAALQYPNSFSLPAEEVIYDTTKKTNRIIRYVLGEESIYKDEQSTLKDVPVKIQRIEFVRGVLNIRPEEPTLLKYILTSSLNESNPNRDKTKTPIFYEYKSETNAAEDLDKSKVLIEAMNFCHTAPWNELRIVALVLGISLDQTPEEVKHHLLKGFAERNPAKFLETLNDKSNKNKYIIIEATKNNVLAVHAADNSIKWSDVYGGGLVCLAPTGVDPVSHLTNQTLADERGAELFSLIKSRSNPVIIGAPKVAEDLYKIQLPDDAQMDLIKEAVAAGVIQDKVSWLYYRKGKPDAKSWNGKKVLLKELAENAEFKAQILDEITKLKIPI